LIELKGCAWFIREVLPRLPRGTRLLVAGPITDPAEGAVLKAPGVEYLGTLDSAELISAYRRALCLVLPNIEPRTGQFEGFGIVAAEASAVGAVVIAADSGGLSDTISDGQTGLLLPPGKPQAWADAIVNVADWSPKKRAHFTAEAMARASRHFTWDRVARETWALCHVPSERSHEQGRKQAAKLVKSKS
jgi:glycosyltransferase involved in cell wall biosynthesis